MNRLAQFGAVFLLATANSLAQVTVETVFEHEQYLASEPLRVGIRITNFSGQTLRMGDTPDWLDLLIESERGRVGPAELTPPIIEPFEIPSSSRATRWVDLVPHFEVGRIGQYKVTPTVRVADLGQEVIGKAATVSITGGARIWEQEFGVRCIGGDAPGALEVRRYALIQAMNQKRVALYVRVADQADVRVFGVLPVGPVLAFSRPEAQVDGASQLHVLSQTSARLFTYCVVSPNGELTVRQLHRYTDGRPALRAKEDGSVTVLGGRRQVTPSDVPAPERKPESAIEPPPTLPPPATTTTPPVPSPKESNKNKKAAKK